MKSNLWRISALSIFVGCVIAGVSAPARASEPTPMPMPSWTGYYGGIQAGYGWGTNSYTYSPPATDIDMDGFVGGLTLGANWQSGSFVFGIEGDVSYSDISGYENTVNDPVPTTPCLLPGANEGCSADVNWFATLRARAGMVAGNWMPYVTGGLAVGGVEGFADTEACGGPVCRYDDTRFGWTIGGGIEAVIDQRWTAKIEYLYVDLGKPSFTAPTVQADNSDFSVVRAGLNYRF